MRLPSLLIALSVGSTMLQAPQSPADGAGMRIDARAAFERLKRLEGTWEGTLIMEGRTIPVTVTYAVNSRGSVVIEDTGMLTTFHLDGDQLKLTHYCTAGNQPRMKATLLDDRHLAFEIYDVTNLRSSDAYRTTSLDLRFISDERIDVEYGGLSAGKKTPPQLYKLTRRRDRQTVSRPVLP